MDKPTVTYPLEAIIERWRMYVVTGDNTIDRHQAREDVLNLICHIDELRALLTRVEAENARLRDRLEAATERVHDLEDELEEITDTAPGEMPEKDVP
jgi:predicted nuclease with TOPRIM domain